jgi:hypothetical protein
MLVQVSRFLINSMGNIDSPFGISKVNIMYTLAKQAKVLGAFKLARFTYVLERASEASAKKVLGYSGVLHHTRSLGARRGDLSEES